MKKDKTDYFKELENFSFHCVAQTENFTAILNNSKVQNDDFDCFNELQKLADLLKKEYFTPIEREDIYILASVLTEIFLSVQRLNCFAEQNSFYKTEIMTLSNFLYSAIQNINEIVRGLSKFPRSDFYDLLFETKKLTEKALNFAEKALQQQFHEIIVNIKESFKYCRLFTDTAIYIYLKNT